MKLVLDGIFGIEKFQNEIVWRRYGAHNDVGQGSRHFGRVHDSIFLYSKEENRTWNQLFTAYDHTYIEQNFKYTEEKTGRKFSTTPLTAPGGSEKGNPVFEWKGHTRAWRYNVEKMKMLDGQGRLFYSKTGYVRQKYYLDESRGVPLQSVWSDIPSLSGTHAERIGYPTQKPLALLERIIAASSNPGDIILDPFCGCGTAVHAAEKLGRSWLGIDVTHLAISLIERRLKDAFPAIKFAVHGTPRDIGAARDLATRNKHQFEYWAVSLVDAVPSGGSRADRTAKKGADRGIDGIRWVRTGPRGDDLDRMIVSVKAGENVSVRDVRDLAGTVQREGALGGVLITLHPATRDMLREAASHGMVSTGLGQVRKVMVKTVAELMADVHDEAERLPPLGRQEGFRRAKRERGADTAEQAGLDL